MAIKIGLTGGIGSGKSVVSRLFEVIGIPVYVSDVESKRLTQTDEIIKSKLTALLGEEIYKDGKLNKPFLASYIFGNPDHVAEVNAIIHPWVRADFEQWLSAHEDCDLVAMESAILIEAGFRNDVDRVVMVYAPMELRMERVLKRDSSSRELITKRMQSQMDDEQKKEYAHYIIYNDGNTPLIPQVERLKEILKQEKLS